MRKIASQRRARLRLWAWYIAAFWPGMLGLLGYEVVDIMGHEGWALVVGALSGLGLWAWLVWLARDGREDRLIAWLRLNRRDIEPR